MRLEHLCDMELTFGPGSGLVLPYGTQEGAAFAEGSGAVTSARLNGTVRWFNRPRRRSDGAMLPDMSGLITTSEGAAILFSMEGLTVWVGGPAGTWGNNLSRISFQTADDRYRWLNDVFCVMEGKVDPQGPMRRSANPARVYICVNELL